MLDRSALKGRPASIALIDSGVETGKCNPNEFVKMSTGFSIKGGYIVEDKEKPIESEHATAISLVIREIAGDVEFISINIFNERLAADFRVLLYALYYVLDELKPDIIHLSLETRKLSHYFPLKDVVKKAIASDVFLVASIDRGLRISFPALIHGVLGVKSSFNLNSNNYGFDGRFFLALPVLEGISGVDCLNRQDYRGSSIAAAFITGHIARIIRKDGWTGRENILAKLIKGSTKMNRKWGFK